MVKHDNNILSAAPTPYNPQMELPTQAVNIATEVKLLSRMAWYSRGKKPADMAQINNVPRECLHQGLVTARSAIMPACHAKTD